MSAGLTSVCMVHKRMIYVSSSCKPCESRCRKVERVWPWNNSADDRYLAGFCTDRKLRITPIMALEVFVEGTSGIVIAVGGFPASSRLCTREEKHGLISKTVGNILRNKFLETTVLSRVWATLTLLERFNYVETRRFVT